MSLTQMSFSGAVMILVIVGIRALTVNHLPKKTFLVLWGVVTVRLLIPYSLRSAFSVYSLLTLFTPAAGVGKDVPVVPFTPVVPKEHMASPPVVSAVDAAAASVDPWTLLWLAGAAVCAVFFTAAYLKCCREFRTSLPVDNEYARRWLSQHRIDRTIEIRQSDRISAPLTYGVFRPVILMPKTVDWDDADTLNYVLEHEYVHIRRFDAVTKLILTAALCVHWFDPAVWMMYVLANRDIELSCDEAVVRRFGERTKSAYAMALIRMEEARSGLLPLCNNFSNNAIEERIVAIMKIRKTSLVSLFASMALVVSVTTAFATSGQAESKDRSPIDILSEEDAFALLEESITYKQDILSFTIPNADTTFDTWSIHVAGRLEYPDGFSSSTHYFNTAEWTRGMTYSEQIGESADYLTELFLSAELGEHRQMIDLLPYVQSTPAGIHESPAAAVNAPEFESYMMVRDIAEETEKTEELLNAYVPFDLSYKIDFATGKLSMSWQGKPVHSVYDTEKAVWIANNMRGRDLGPDAVDLEAVYEQGELTGLRETQDQPIAQTNFVLWTSAAR